MYMGGYAVAWFGEPPHEQPWVTTTPIWKTVTRSGWRDLRIWHAGMLPFYATANRLYFKVGSGSAEPAKEVFALMQRVETIHKDSVPVPYVSDRADLGVAAVVAGEGEELELADDERGYGTGHAG